MYQSQKIGIRKNKYMYYKLISYMFDISLFVIKITPYKVHIIKYISIGFVHFIFLYSNVDIFFYTLKIRLHEMISLILYIVRLYPCFIGIKVFGTGNS